MDDTNTTAKKTYVCTGTCGAHITEEEYNNGLTVCGTEGCTMKGQPFVEENAEQHAVHTAAADDKDEDATINNS